MRGPGEGGACSTATPQPFSLGPHAARHGELQKRLSAQECLTPLTRRCMRERRSERSEHDARDSRDVLFNALIFEGVLRVAPRDETRVTFRLIERLKFWRKRPLKRRRPWSIEPRHRHGCLGGVDHRSGRGRRQACSEQARAAPPSACKQPPRSQARSTLPQARTSRTSRADGRDAPQRCARLG